MDIAELGLSIRSDDAPVATRRLGELERQAGKTERSGMLLAKAFAVLTAAFSVQKLIDFTNRWTDLNSRVEIATGSIGAGTTTMQRLAEMARRTYSSLDLTAESFLRNATAMRELGATTGQTLDYVEAINNALVVSGARAERAESVMNALSKAMALGKLSGDNLNTVIESGGRVAQALADSLGVSTLELRAMGAAGKITSADIFGITSQLELLREEADSMPATIGDAFVLLGNSILTMVGQFDEAQGASSRVAEAIIFVADAMNSGVISIERILAYGTSLALFMSGMWVASFITANGAVGALTISLGLLRTALIRTGFGALVVLAGEMIHQISQVVGEAKSLGEAFDMLRKSGIDTWQRIVAGGEALQHAMESLAARVVQTFANAWGNILQGFIVMVNQMQRESGIQIIGPEAMSAIAQANLDAFKRGDHYGALAVEHAEKAAAAWGRVFEDKSTADGIGTMPGWGEVQGGFGAAGTITAPGGGSGGKENPYDKLIRGANEYIAAQRLEAQALGMTTEAAALLRHEQDLLNKAANDNIALSPAQRAELEALAASMAQAEAALAGAQFAMSNPDPFSDLKNQLSELDAALAASAISWDLYGAAALRANSGAANSVLGMAGQITGALGQMFQENKGIALANAVVNTAEAITKAMATYGPTPWGFAAAGVAAATGAAQIAAIMSAQKGSASVRGVSGGGAGASSAAQAAPAQRQIGGTIIVHGSQSDFNMIDGVVKGITEMVNADGANDLVLAIKRAQR